jgi:mannose-6-phosphate isomerase-like protein (cupin superfamily)
MASAGQTIEGHGGFGLRLIRTAAETDGELLEMEATYSGDGVLPPEHFHPSQDERFEVLEGTIRAILDDEVRVYEAGDVFEVPAGTPHQMAATSPARVNWQVRPALRTAEFFEGLYGSGPDSASELGVAFLERYADEFRLGKPE